MTQSNFRKRVPELARRYTESRKSIPGFSDFTYVGSGASQVVFEVAETRKEKGREKRGVVLKADVDFIRLGLENIVNRRIAHLNPIEGKRLEQEQELDEQEEYLRTEMNERIHREQDFYRTLKKFFPRETILNSRIRSREVPVTAEIAHEVLNETELADAKIQPGEVIEVPTIVRYQHPLPDQAKNKNEGGENPDAHSFGFRYVERYNLPDEEYDRFNRMCHSREEPFDLELFSKFVHVGTARSLERAQTDPEVKKALTELVRRSIQFTKHSREMIDLAGGGNVRLYKEDGEWKTVIMDPFAHNEWSEAEEAIRKLLMHDFRITVQQVNSLLNAVNYERLLNGMARALDMEDHLQLGPVNLDLPNMLQNVLQENFGWPDRTLPEYDVPATKTVQKTLKIRT